MNENALAAALRQHDPRGQKITLLCSRRYQGFALIQKAKDRDAYIAGIRVLPGVTINTEHCGTMYDLAMTYYAELRTLSDAELEEKYRAELEKMKEEDKVRADMQERAHFYHDAAVSADFQHWARMAHWTIEEAVALLHGKDPKQVNSLTLKGKAAGSALHKQYDSILEVARRAVQWQHLYDPVLPALFIRWARDNEYPVPEQLDELVARFHMRWPDWQKKYEALDAAFDEFKASALDEVKSAIHQTAEMTKAGMAKQVADAQAVAEGLRRENEVLRAQVQAPVIAPTPPQASAPERDKKHRTFLTSIKRGDELRYELAAIMDEVEASGGDPSNFSTVFAAIKASITQDSVIISLDENGLVFRKKRVGDPVEVNMRSLEERIAGMVEVRNNPE